MPILPRVPTRFDKVTYFYLTAHYSRYKHGREKTAKITMEFGAPSKTQLPSRI